MTRLQRYKLANEPAEFEAIHRLNYRTFVKEIPQHSPNETGRLVDRFHSENLYAICLEGDELIGMVAGRCNRPFSLDQKLANLDDYLPTHQKAVEIRLLAVEPFHRKRSVFARLVALLGAHFRHRGCDLALISGTVRERRLYDHLGFVPFGPVVGDARARFQPMFLTLEAYLAHVARLESFGRRNTKHLIPGSRGCREETRASDRQDPSAHPPERLS